MENNNKPKGSFFRRAEDAEPRAERPAMFDNSDYREESERPSRPPFRRAGEFSKSPFRSSSSNRSGEGRPFDRNSDRGERRSFDRDSDGGERRSFDRSEGRGEGRPFQSRGDKPRGDRPQFRKPQRDIEPREAPENIIFGIHPVREAIEAGQVIEKIYFRRQGDGRDGFGNSNAAIDALRSIAEDNSIPSQEVPAEKLDRLSRRNNHQGVIAVIPAIEYAEINDVIAKVEERGVPALIVVVDGVTDIRNFGAIARSAECAGADAIIMSAKNSAPVNAEAIKSSAGALTTIPVCRVGSIRNTLKTLQMAGMKIMAITEKSQTLIYEAKFTESVVLIMGAEDRGISSEVLKMCDARVAIPLLGKIESLNVSAAAAVLLFEVVRQRFEAIEETN